MDGRVGVLEFLLLRLHPALELAGEYLLDRLLPLAGVLGITQSLHALAIDSHHLLTNQGARVDSEPVEVVLVLVLYFLQCLLLKEVGLGVLEAGGDLTPRLGQRGGIDCSNPRNCSSSPVGWGCGVSSARIRYASDSCIS